MKCKLAGFCSWHMVASWQKLFCCSVEMVPSTALWYGQVTHALLSYYCSQPMVE